MMGSCQTDLGSFCAGTLIRTPQGAVPVELLQAGALVSTMDHGAQPIVWLGKRRIAAAQLRDDPALRPLLFKAGTFGPDQPSCDLRIAGHQALFVRIAADHRLFETSDMLFAAADYARDAEPEGGEIQDVIFYHLAFANAQIIWANDVACESAASACAPASDAPQDRVWGTSLFQRHRLDRRPPLALVPTPARETAQSLPDDPLIY